jgi:hypothetical protein
MTGPRRRVAGSPQDRRQRSSAGNYPRVTARPARNGDQALQDWITPSDRRVSWRIDLHDDGRVRVSRRTARMGVKPVDLLGDLYLQIPGGVGCVAGHSSVATRRPTAKPALASFRTAVRGLQLGGDAWEYGTERAALTAVERLMADYHQPHRGLGICPHGRWGGVAHMATQSAAAWSAPRSATALLGSASLGELPGGAVLVVADLDARLRPGADLAVGRRKGYQGCPWVTSSFVRWGAPPGHPRAPLGNGGRRRRRDPPATVSHNPLPPLRVCSR